jgi:hypothetical protein
MYMEIPKVKGVGDLTKVCKLNRTLYDLKQAPKAWHSRINYLFLKLGLIRSNVNAHMYYKDRKRIIILLYVDDLLLTRDDKKIKWVQKMLMKNLK